MSRLSRRNTPSSTLLYALPLLFLFITSNWAMENCTVPQVDEARLPKAQTKDEHGCLVLPYTCVDQEALIVFAEQYRNGSQELPELHTEAMRNLVRPLRLPGQHSRVAPNKQQWYKHLRGHELNYHSPYIRIPTLQEEGFTSEDLGYFSKCTVPIITYSDWQGNMVEFIARTLVNVWGLLKAEIVKGNVTFVMANPAKSPLSSFHDFWLRPFSPYQVTTFATFSSRLPSSFPSNATAEGRHTRCFEKLLLCKFGGNYPGMVEMAHHLLKFYKPQMPPASALDSFWAPGAHVLRVLFEVRQDTNHRQVLNLEDVLGWCNSGAANFTFPPGSNFTQLQCRKHMWGVDRMMDLAVASSTDVLVAVHGAGESNGLFMQPGRSLVELRPYEFGTKHGFSPMMWWPFIIPQNQFALLFWALNLEDPALYRPSSNVDNGILSEEGFVKERNVILPVDALMPILSRICETGFDRVKFWQLWKENKVVFNYHNNGTVWNSETINGAQWDKAPWE